MSSEMNDLVRLTEELGLYDTLPAVCVTHKRFIPCRRNNELSKCIFSSDPEDIDMVRKFQSGT